MRGTLSKERVGHIVDEYLDMRKKALFKVGAARAHNRPKNNNAKLQELLSHPLYSPDLAPSDFFLFSDFKRMLAGKKFCADEEVIEETALTDSLDSLAHRRNVSALSLYYKYYHGS